MSLYHVKTQTVPDSTATSLVRPSDWNSAHAQAMTISGNTAGQSTFSGTNIVFQGGSNVTLSANTGANAATVVISAAAGGGVVISAGTNSTSTGTVAFADSNGLTFGMNTNGVVTGSYTVPSVPAQTAYVFSNSNGVSFGTAGSTVTASVQTDYVAGSNSSLFQQVSNTSAITSDAMNTSERGNYFYTSNNTFANSTHSHGNIAFSGTNVSATFTTASNGLSIQLSAPSVAGAQTGISGLSAGTTQMTSGTAVFANSNGVSFGVNGNTITASHNGLTQQSTQPVAYSAANGSANFSTLTFANSNGVSFSTGTQGLYATVKTDYLTTARASNDAIGLNTAVSNVTATINSSGLSLDARGYAGTGTTTAGANVSFSVTLNSNGLNLSGSVSPGGAGDGYNSAQFTNSTANSTMPILWAGNSNGSGNITVGLTGSTVTMSAPSGGGGVAISAGAASQNTGTVIFSNSNGISFGLNAGTVTASYTVPTQTVQPVAYSAANGSANFSTLTFANSNGVSFSTGTQGLYATVKTDYQSSNANYLTSQSNQAYSAANGSVAFQTITFANSNGVSFSTGTQGLYASHNGITQQSTQPVAYSAANGSANFSTLTFANSNGVSFSTGTQGVYATVRTDYLTTARASNDAIGLNTAQTNVTWTVNSSGFSLNAAGYAGTGTTFGGTNVSATIGLNSNGLNLQLSAPTPGGGGAINVSAGTTSNNVQTLQFNNANGVTFGLNGSTVTASVNAGGGGITEDNFFPHKDALWAAHQVGQNSIQVQPLAGVPTFSYDRLAYAVQYSQATNSTLTVSATIQLGFYTLNGSTLSLVTSGSGSFSINGQGTNSSSANSGPRWATMTLNGGTTVGGDDLWVAFKSSTATAGVNASLSNICASRINSTWSGFIGVGTANSVQSLPGMGYYSATSAGMPSTMAISHITGNSSTAQRPQIFYLSNGAFVQ